MTETPFVFPTKADVIRLAADRPAVHALLDRLAAQDHATFVLIVALAAALDRRLACEVAR